MMFPALTRIPVDTIGSLLAEKLGVADLGSADFEILGNLVLISGCTTEQGF
jgi:hypothetical protein